MKLLTIIGMATPARLAAALGMLLAALMLLAPVAARAQVRHRRPLAAAPSLSYHFDNNGGGGCRDYACGGRCYDGHSGTDMPVPLGTSVLASAEGTVVATNNGCANYGAVGNTCGGRCGNYVQIQHADGNQTIYCHMMLNSLRVSRGQRVGCGQEIGRSASSGSSSGPHLHFGWRTGGVSRDPFHGSCSGTGGVWTQQNPYPQMPGAGCEGPPPPPPCTARQGPFGWNCSGPIAGMTCTQIGEGSDPHTWGDNYFCSDIDRGIRWSSAGPIAGMTCTQVSEGAEPAAHTWGDNFLCAPTWLPYRFRWSSAGPIAGMSCLPWAEPADPHTWNDNFLCWTRDDVCLRRAGPFAWSCAGPVSGMSCVAVHESSDPHTWSDNFVCGPQGIGLRWSSAGPIAGMDCTAVNEGSEPAAHTWTDNFLCVPRGSGYTFRFATAGPIAGMTCLQWYEPADPHTWEDNFLCWQYVAPMVDAGSPTRDAAVDAARDVADVTVADAAVADVVDAEAIDAALDRPEVIGLPDIGIEDAAVIEDLPPVEDVSIEEHLIPAEEDGGCGCGVPSGGRPRTGAALGAALLVALGARRRRARHGA